jgi:hypothetical protein
VLAFNLDFMHMTQLTGKTSAPFERTLNFGLIVSLQFSIYYIMHLYIILAFVEHGNTYESAHACRTYKQAVVYASLSPAFSNKKPA